MINYYKQLQAAAERGKWELLEEAHSKYFGLATNTDWAHIYKYQRAENDILIFACEPNKDGTAGKIAAVWSDGEKNPNYFYNLAAPAGGLKNLLKELILEYCGDGEYFAAALAESANAFTAGAKVKPRPWFTN